ncbi:MAG: FkbM family methyltransferase [Hyphomicrobium sp.]
MTGFMRSMYRRARARYRIWKEPDFLQGCRGVIHVGANAGQERDHYDALGLKVIWIEPIAAVFDQLQRNIAGRANQSAIRALITDADGERKVLHIANNNGASSSILDFADHKLIWPEVEYVDAVELETTRLPTALAAHGADIASYDALVLDTQGSELVILKGAAEILGGFRRMVIEASDFNAYEGNPTDKDICAFLAPRGFRLVERRKFAESGKGSYFDLHFQR